MIQYPSCLLLEFLPFRTVQAIEASLPKIVEVVYSVMEILIGNPTRSIDLALQ